MNRVLVACDAFRDKRTHPYSERFLGGLLWTTVYGNQAFLAVNPSLPLYKTKIRWQREVPRADLQPQEQFLGVRQIMQQGWADCEDLACWVVAARRLGQDRTPRGLPPRAGHPPVTKVPVPWPMKPIGPNVVPGFFHRQITPNKLLYHIVVCWPDGYIEDPSRMCGMGGEA